MVHILVIAGYTPSLINFRGELLKSMIARGHQVTAASPEPDEISLKSLADMGIAHHAIPMQRTGMNPLRDMRTLISLGRLMGDIRPDHVLSYTIKPVIYGSLSARRAGVPAIHAMITGLGTTFQTDGLRGGLLRGLSSQLYRAALSGCCNVIFQNADDRDLFIAHKLVTPETTRVVDGSGVDLDHFAHSPPTVGPPRFLLVARLLRDKGIREYAEAARLVKARYPDAIFRLVGYFEDHTRAVSEDEVRAWTDTGVLEYLGPTDDVRPALRDCSVYCLPSYAEGLPRTVLEAMAIGRAIVTTDVPGCRETVSEDENGFLVPARDPEALAGALMKFCEDPGLCTGFGERSRRMAEQRFDVHRVNEAMIGWLGL